MFLVGVFWGIHRGRGPPCVLHFENFRNGEYKMSKCIKIRIRISTKMQSAKLNIHTSPRRSMKLWLILSEKKLMQKK